MTKEQIEKFSIGYPYPTDYIEILLKKYNYDTVKVNNILNCSYEDIIKEVRNTNGVTFSGLISIMEGRWRKRNEN